VAAALRETVDGLARQPGVSSVTLLALLKGSDELRDSPAAAAARRALNPTVWKWRRPRPSELEPGCALTHNQTQTPWHLRHAEATLGQLGGFSECLSAVERLENRGKRFDAIVRMRPDAVFLEPLPEADWSGVVFAGSGVSQQACAGALAADKASPANRPPDWFFSLPRPIARHVLGLARVYRAECRAANASGALGHGFDMESVLWGTALAACASSSPAPTVQLAGVHLLLLIERGLEARGPLQRSSKASQQRLCWQRPRPSRAPPPCEDRVDAFLDGDCAAFANLTAAS